MYIAMPHLSDSKCTKVRVVESIHDHDASSSCGHVSNFKDLPNIPCKVDHMSLYLHKILQASSMTFNMLIYA